MAAAAVGLGGGGVGSGCLLEPPRLCTIQHRTILSNLPAIRPSIVSVSPSAKFTSNLTLRLRAQRRSSSSTSKPNTALPSIPARDRVVEFGKHRGKMLGSLPSSYLRWISKNLRARDFEEWAKLADEVLEDPVYRDRIEWEYAEGVLNGNCMSSPRRDSAVSELLEISERFGWDNEGWSRVNFELLGTSRGGRIPRRKDGRGLSRGTDGGNGSGMVKRRGVDLESDSDSDSELSEEDKRRRRERRERLRLKRLDRPNLYGIGGGGGGGLAPPPHQVTRRDGRVGRGEREEEEDALSSDSGLDSSTGRAEEVYNPFPGRQGLLKKLIGLRQRRSM